MAGGSVLIYPCHRSSNTTTFQNTHNSLDLYRFIDMYTQTHTQLLTLSPGHVRHPLGRLPPSNPYPRHLNRLWECFTGVRIASSFPLLPFLASYLSLENFLPVQPIFLISLLNITNNTYPHQKNNAQCYLSPHCYRQGIQYPCLRRCFARAVPPADARAHRHSR